MTDSIPNAIAEGGDPATRLRWLPVPALLLLTLWAALNYHGGYDRAGLLGAWAGLMALVAALGWVGAFRNWRPDWVGWAALAMCGWLAASLGWSVLRFVSIDLACLLALLPASYLLIRSVPAPLRGDVMAALRWLGLAMMAMAIAEFLITHHRATALFSDANAFAAFVNALFFPAYAELLDARSRRQPPSRLALATALVAAPALVVTTSLGGLLCFVPLFMLTSALGLRRGRAAWPVVGLLVALLLASHAFVYSVQSDRPSPFSRVSAEVRSGGQATIEQGSFLHERLAMFRSALAIAGDHPLLGSGPGTFKLLYPRYRSADDQTTAGNLVHNDYLQFLAEGGPLLLAALLALLAGAAVPAVRLLVAEWRGAAEARPGARLPLLGIAAGLAALFGHALVNFIFYVAPLALLAGACLGLFRTGACERAGPRPEAVGAAPLSPRLGWTLWGLAVVLLASTLGAQTLFGLIQNQRCELHLCNELGNDSPRMLAFANAMVALQPSWFSARDYLAKETLEAAGRSTDEATRFRLGAQAAAEYAAMIRISPAYPFAYRQLADLLLAHPELARSLPPGTPAEPLELYRLASQLDPLDYSALTGYARLLALHGDDEAVMRLMDRANQFRDLALVTTAKHSSLMLQSLPSAVRLGRCADAQELAAAARTITPTALTPLVTEVLRAMPPPRPGEALPVLPSAPGCGLPPESYALPAPSQTPGQSPQSPQSP